MLSASESLLTNMYEVFTALLKRKLRFCLQFFFQAHSQQYSQSKVVGVKFEKKKNFFFSRHVAEIAGETCVCVCEGDG